MSINVIRENVDISSKIFEVRGVQVMLDSDLAILYQCTNGTKDLNKAVKRNINRFPDNFMFQLSDDELDYLRFQIGTSNKKGGRRYNPYVFTEQGVAMLSSVLHSDVAIEVSIKIINAFVAMRRYISNSLYSTNFVLNNHEDRILKLEKSLLKMNENNKVNAIFFDVQIYDSYSLLIDILNKAYEEIIIIDNYAGKELLDILKIVNKKIILISKNIDDVLVSKYNKQYSNIKFKKSSLFHDRFIIIDKKILYHCGSSFKDLGKKCFAINQMEEDILTILLDKLTNIY